MTIDNEETQNIRVNNVHIVDWLFALARLNQEPVFKKYEELKLPVILLKLFYKYKTHSVMHANIYRIFHQGIHSENPDIVDLVLSCRHHSA